ncbi:MAG: hypothetical protein RI538_09415 [Salibaculum sp.]|jgi:hypothetical protein|uniref:hypothetical protein n=1 Tax=Roseovarius halophilus (ex Wu et al. 2025) TaxID=3376060 RepID=UPI00286FFF89|nr:hypothetical protein [Salibaculum sp.]MDR9428588.1 hypothetical protein [Salibaculum sp.]MDR9482980.1 hypothetical protein [Salibaculum sp.]
MRPILALIALLGTAACGADAPPVRPSAGVGVSVDNAGVSTNANLGATNGIVSVGLSL